MAELPHPGAIVDVTREIPFLAVMREQNLEIECVSGEINHAK
jgi:hypothetical protein